MNKEERLDVDLKIGLTSDQVDERVELKLTNKTKSGSSKTYSRIIFTNIFTFFNMLIVIIAALLIYVGAYKDIFFLVIVVTNTLIGIIQEIKAKITIDKLSLLSAPVGTVLRDGKIIEIPISDIVLDDILTLKSGKQISADAVIKEGFLEVDESLLTGESEVVDKKVGDFLYSGSYVVSGTCLAQTVNVGEKSYIESLTNKARQYKKPESNLMGSLKIMIRIIAIFIVPIGILLFNMHRTTLGEPLDDSIRKTAGALVGMIPSGLFLLTSMALAVGVIRLAQNNTLVQELYCIEMLARVDTLCLDKTGTITDGTMEVKGVIEIDDDESLSPNIFIPQLLGVLNETNQTSEAIISKFGKEASKYKIEEQLPFSSKRKFSAVSFEGKGTFILGAPEFVLNKTELRKINNIIDEYINQGLRVLVYAHSNRTITAKKLPPHVRPISLIVIEDTIRRDAIYTIEYFKDNGVDVKVISGDNATTVSHIAARAGINNADKYISLEDLSNEEVKEIAPHYQVFGRVTPEQKQILVQSLKENGKTVAMVGDGVNDILALKEADTSIAMASGSEATRNVSHLVLLDSSFSSMPKVVNEGRRVINNIQNVATLFLTKTIFSIMLTIVILLLAKPYPITPSQLFLIDFLAIGFPAFFISLQPNNEIVKGTFMKNVLKAAFPGAITIVVQVLLIITFFNNRLSFSALDQSALVVITASFTSMVVLYRLLLPFNVYRRTLFFVLFLVVIFSVLFLPEFFEFSAIIPYYIRMGKIEVTNMSFNLFLLLLLMVRSSNIFINIFRRMPGWLSKAFSWSFKKLSGI